MDAWVHRRNSDRPLQQSHMGAHNRIHFFARVVVNVYAASWTPNSGLSTRVLFTCGLLHPCLFKVAIPKQIRRTSRRCPTGISSIVSHQPLSCRPGGRAQRSACIYRIRADRVVGGGQFSGYQPFQVTVALSVSKDVICASSTSCTGLLEAEQVAAARPASASLFHLNHHASAPAAGLYVRLQRIEEKRIELN